jgi:hypothetical protein
MQRAYANLADAGTAFASSSVSLAPPSWLQGSHVARNCRGNDNPMGRIAREQLEFANTVIRA